MGQLQDLNHKHILVTATHLRRMPEFVDEVDSWLRRLVSAVGMKILMGPYVVRCDTEGNEGITGVVVIETSHASIHMWTECDVPFLKMDLYSCKDFEWRDVLNLVKEFAPSFIGFDLIDRNGGISKHITSKYFGYEWEENLDA